MKNTKRFWGALAVAVLSAVPLSVCSKKAEEAAVEAAAEGEAAPEAAAAEKAEPKPSTYERDYKFSKDESYAFGVWAGMNLLNGFHATLNEREFLRGMRAAQKENSTPRIDREQAMEILSQLNYERGEVLQKVQEEKNAAEAEKRKAEAEGNLAKGKAYLDDNGKKAGVFTTPSGLQYEVLVQGSGPRPTASSRVRVDYEGKLLDGTVFDSSYTRGQPAEFPLGGVIKGWTEGLQLMEKGASYRFFIPPDLAYGENGTGNIPPNSTLIFKVDLLEVLDE
jgi:FKBP-type peptidyl-prolyl cis-trans isomerase